MNPMEMMKDTFGESFGHAVADTFRYMEWAEEEIGAACVGLETQQRKDIANDCFMCLLPSFIGWPPENVYRRHCQQVIERALNGEVFLVSTEAAMCWQWAQASLRSPLTRAGMIAYMECSRVAFPEQMEDILGKEIGQEIASPTKHELSEAGELNQGLAAQIERNAKACGYKRPTFRTNPLGL